MKNYTYTLKSNKHKHEVTFRGSAINFAQMLGKIEREKNLEEWRITQIKEIR